MKLLQETLKIVKNNDDCPLFNFFGKSMNSTWDFLTMFFSSIDIPQKYRDIGNNAIIESPDINIYRTYFYRYYILIVLPNNSFSRRKILYRLKNLTPLRLDNLVPECIEFTESIIYKDNPHVEILVLGSKEQIKNFNSQFKDYLTKSYAKYLLFFESLKNKDKDKDIDYKNHLACVYSSQKRESTVSILSDKIKRIKTIQPNYNRVSSYYFGKVFNINKNEITIDYSLDNSFEFIKNLTENQIEDLEFNKILKLNPIRVIELLKEDLKNISSKFNVEYFMIHEGSCSLGKLLKKNNAFTASTEIHDYITISPVITYSSDIFFNEDEIHLELVNDQLMLHHSVWCQRTTNWSYSIGIDQEFSIFRFFDWMLNQFLPSANGKTRLSAFKQPKDLIQFKLPNRKVSNKDILKRINELQNI